MRDKKSDEAVVVFILAIIIIIMWLFPVIYLSNKINNLESRIKNEITIKVEIATPAEPPEDALSISVNY